MEKEGNFKKIKMMDMMVKKLNKCMQIWEIYKGLQHENIVATLQPEKKQFLDEAFMVLV